MVRTVVIPQSSDLHLSIPDSYIGKRVEVIFFDLDEAEIDKNNTSFQLTENQENILKERLKAPKSRYISEKDSFSKLDEI